MPPKCLVQSCGHPQGVALQRIYYKFFNHCANVRYVVGSKSFRPDIQKPRQMENAVRDI